MNKKILILTAATLAACGAFARPHGFGPRHGWHHPPPIHHHHHGYWGRGGCHFWPGFVGGVVGGAIASTIVEPAPVVVTTPVVTTPVVTQPVVVQPVVTQPVPQVQNVWVEGRYVDQVQANGSVVRVWSPGHYEQRTVIVQ